MMDRPTTHHAEVDFTHKFDEEIAPDLKVEINTFLWTRLPPTTTLGEADAIACDWYEAIKTRWDTEHLRQAGGGQ